MEFFSQVPANHPKGWPWICQRRNAYHWHVIKPSWAKKESNPEAFGSGFTRNEDVTDFADKFYPYSGEWEFINYYYDKVKQVSDPRPSEEFFRGNYSRG